MTVWLLNNWRPVGVLLLALALGGYAAVQRLGRQQVEAEFAQFRADVQAEAAAASVRAAQEAARRAQNAQETIDALQARNAALSARYKRLRDAKPSPGGVPDLSTAAPVLSSCGPKHIEPDATARFLGAVESALIGILEAGDAEIAKYVQLWALQQKNASEGVKP